jgi:hypothetical protein
MGPGGRAPRSRASAARATCTAPATAPSALAGRAPTRPSRGQPRRTSRGRAATSREDALTRPQRTRSARGGIAPFGATVSCERRRDTTRLSHERARGPRSLSWLGSQFWAPALRRTRASDCVTARASWRGIASVRSPASPPAVTTRARTGASPGPCRQRGLLRRVRTSAAATSSCRPPFSRKSVGAATSRSRPDRP